LYNNLIVDCNNLFWRTVCTSIKDVTKVDGAQIYSSVLVNFLDRIKELKRQFLSENGKMYLLFDNPTSTIKLRKLIDESYKHSRTDKDVPKAFWDTLFILQEVLKVYENDYIIVRADSCEADDLVVNVLKRCEGKSLLVSADLDWARSISKSSEKEVVWFNFHDQYTLEFFNMKYGFYPDGNKIKIYKAIRGDKSDCIEASLPHIPEATVIHLLENYGDVEDIIKNVCKDDQVNSTWKTRIKDNWQKLTMNYQLVDFIDVPDSEIKFIECTYVLSGLKIWYRMLDMPFEARMITEKSEKKMFFAKKKLTRAKQY